MSIPEKVKEEALRIAGGLFRMNARFAVIYAFTYEDGEITFGEFVYAGEAEERLPSFENILVLATGHFYSPGFDASYSLQDGKLKVKYENGRNQTIRLYKRSS